MENKEHNESLIQKGKKKDKFKEIGEVEEEGKNLHMCSPPNDFLESYGPGIYMYYDFTRALIIFNFVVGVLQSICYIYDIIAHTKKYGNWSLGNMHLFSSILDPGISRTIWVITSYLIFVMSLLLGPLYFLRIYQLKTEWHSEYPIEEYCDAIKGRKEKGSPHWKRALSFVATFIFGLISCLFTAFVTAMGHWVSSGANRRNKNIASGISSVLIGLIISIGAKLWPLLALELNKFEDHKNWSSYRTSYVGKILAYKIAQIVAVGYLKLGTLSDKACAIDTYGSLYLLIFLTDLTVNNYHEILMPIFEQLKNNESGISKETGPEFDLEEEYLQLFYKQFLLYNSLYSFPLSGMLVCFIFGVEYFSDKVKLTFVCKRPHPSLPLIGNSIFHCVLLSILPIIAFLNLGGGGIFHVVLPFFDPDSFPNCHVFGTVE